MHAVDRICGRGRGVTQIERALILRSHVAVAEVEPQRPQRQVSHTVLRCEELSVDDGARLGRAALEYESAHLGQMVDGSLTCVLVGRSRPEGLLVKVNLLARHTSVDHGSDMRVTERQRLPPRSGRCRVTQFEFRFRGRNRAAQQQRQGDSQGHSYISHHNRHIATARHGEQPNDFSLFF